MCSVPLPWWTSGSKINTRCSGARARPGLGHGKRAGHGGGSGDRHVVEQAEPHGAIAFGVMAGRTDRTKRAARGAAKYRGRCLQRGARRVACGVDAAGRHGGVRVQATDAAAQRQDRVHVCAVVYAQQCFPRRSPRFASVHPVGQPAALYRGGHGGQPRRAFLVPRSGIMVQAGGMRVPVHGRTGVVRHAAMVHRRPIDGQFCSATAHPGPPRRPGSRRSSPGGAARLEQSYTGGLLRPGARSVGPVPATAR